MKAMSPQRFGQLFVFQIAMNVLVLSFIIAQLVFAASRLERIQEAQIEYVQDQNTLTLCGQHEMLAAVRVIGRKLGLPVAEIVAPDINPDTCATLSTEITEESP